MYALRMADAAFQASARLGQMAHEETGYGIPAHKKLKNELASKGVWNSIKDIPTVGVIHHDAQRNIYEIAWPMGVIAALTPSTKPPPRPPCINPYRLSRRAMLLLLLHNPAAAKCTYETLRGDASRRRKSGSTPIT